MSCLVASASHIRQQCRFASGGSVAADEVKEAENTFMGKFKKEMIKMLKMQIILVPIMVLVMMFMYPPVNKAEEKRLKAEYERVAGWKT